MEILIADDDRIVRQSLESVLAAHGYSVRTAGDGRQALSLYASHRPDLVLLDVMMPKLDGYHVCRKIRETDADTPILFLTALSSDADELRGLGVGANQYISKMVSDEVLLARIAAALRASKSIPSSDVFSFEGWQVDPARMEMVLDGTAHPTALFEREVSLLRLFATHPGEVFSRDFLLTRFWGLETESGDAALTMAIYRLREKLGLQGRMIETIRCGGYVYRPDKGVSA